MMLGIESSCDESSAAVLSDPFAVASNVISSQMSLHGPYGGVVPEMASREHVAALPLVIEAALQEAGVAFADLAGVAVTYGPGLAGSLLTGLATARGLSARLSVPLIGVNHLHGHIFSAFLSPGAPSPADVYPFMALVVSGGHSCLIKVSGVNEFKLLGQTVDDAAGEAFDKGATLMGLGYPGGPVIDRLAEHGDRAAIDFPRGRVTSDAMLPEGLDPALCFSFSGLKTALRYYLEENPLAGAAPPTVADVAASYQEAIVDALVKRTVRVLEQTGIKTLVVGGGVSLNRRLRQVLGEACASLGVQHLLTLAAYGGDNGAMIAMVAAMGGGRRGAAMQQQDIVPGLSVLAS